MATLRRYPRFLGKATLFRIPPLWPFLKLAGVIPVYRTVDAGGRGSQRVGVRHEPPAPARRAAWWPCSPRGSATTSPRCSRSRRAPPGSPSRRPTTGGADGLVTVAVGLVYDAKARFRSRALVRVGEPEPWPGGPEAYDATNGRHGARRHRGSGGAARPGQLRPTRRGRRPSSSRRVAAVVVRTPGRPDGRRRRHWPIRSTVAARLAMLAARCPRRPCGRCCVDFAAYERDLDLLGVNDAQLVARRRHAACGSRSCGPSLKVIVAVPFAVIGVVVHVIPFQIMKQVAKRPDQRGHQGDGEAPGLLRAVRTDLYGGGRARRPRLRRLGRARSRPSPHRSAATSPCGYSSGSSGSVASSRATGSSEGHRDVRATRSWRTGPPSCTTRGRSSPAHEPGDHSLRPRPRPGGGGVAAGRGARGPAARRRADPRRASGVSATQAADAPAGPGRDRAGAGWPTTSSTAASARLGRGGWPETFEDVSDAIDALAAGRRAWTCQRVATCGHSAGGHLALWAASSRSTGDPAATGSRWSTCAPPPRWPGVVDLDAAARQSRRAGAVQALMGGGPDEFPDRYRLGSPAALLPDGQAPVPPARAGRRLGPTVAERALRGDGAWRLGDPAVYVPLPGVGAHGGHQRPRRHVRAELMARPGDRPSAGASPDRLSPDLRSR